MKNAMMFLVAVSLVGCAHEERATGLSLDDGTVTSACCSDVEWAGDSLYLWVGDEHATLILEANGWTSFTTGPNARVELDVGEQIFSTLHGGTCSVTIDPVEGDGATSGSFTCTQIAEANGNARDVNGTFVAGKDKTSQTNDPTVPFIVGGIIGNGGW